MEVDISNNVAARISLRAAGSSMDQEVHGKQVRQVLCLVHSCFDKQYLQQQEDLLLYDKSTAGLGIIES